MAPRCPLALLLGAALLAGCSDVAGPDREEDAREVVFDLRPLFASAGGERCVTVVESLSLVVEDADGTRQTRERALTPEDAEVTFSVEVAPGVATFTAEVLSNNGTVLYEGTVQETIEEGRFRVEVPLQPVNAVLKACPDRVPLLPADGPFRGDLAVINRGSRPVAWTATFESPPCDGEPCLDLVPSDTTTAPRDTTTVRGSFNFDTTERTFDVRITSEIGTLDVVFEVMDGGR